MLHVNVTRVLADVQEPALTNELGPALNQLICLNGNFSNMIVIFINSYNLNYFYCLFDGRTTAT